MYRRIQIFYIISSLTTILWTEAITLSAEWDSPLCQACNDEVTTTTGSPDTSVEQDDTASKQFRASSSSISSESTSSEISDEISVTTAADTEIVVTAESPTTIPTTKHKRRTTSQHKQNSNESQHGSKKKKKKEESSDEKLSKSSEEETLGIPDATSDHEFKNKNLFGNIESEKVERKNETQKEVEYEPNKIYKQVDKRHEHHYTIDHNINEYSQVNMHQEIKEKIPPKVERASEWYSNQTHNRHNQNRNKIQKEVDDIITSLDNETNGKQEDKDLERNNSKIKTRSRHEKKKIDSTEEIMKNINKVVFSTNNRHKKKNTPKFKSYLESKNINNSPKPKYFDTPFKPHKIKDDVQINAFTKQIFLRTMRVFEDIKKEGTESQWKKKIKRLAENYEHKFKEFLRTTAQQDIKTKLGIQKVILNAIDMSNMIVNRLLNIMVDEIDKKGLLRMSHTQDVLYSELRKEVDSEIKHACSKLGICTAYNGLTQILIDVLKTMISLNNKTFREAFDSLTEVVKYTDFTHTFGKHVDTRLKRKIKSVEDDNVKNQRAMMVIMKNILLNRNKPLVLYSDSNPKQSNLKGTLAFLEVIDILDKAVPINEANIEEWTGIRDNIMGWSHGEGIQSTVTKFINHLKKIIDDLDNKSGDAVRKNVNKIFL